MTAEEAIVLIEDAASFYPTMDIAIFSERVREDIAIFRREIHPPDIMWTEKSGAKMQRIQPELSIPPKYKKNAEVWIVFSAFVACFLDPIDFGCHAMEVFNDLPGDYKLDRIVFLSDSNREEKLTEEIELRDFVRIQNDIIEMRNLIVEIGQSLFGKRFDIRDIDGRQITNE